MPAGPSKVSGEVIVDRTDAQKIYQNRISTVKAYRMTRILFSRPGSGVLPSRDSSWIPAGELLTSKTVSPETHCRHTG